MLERSDIRPRSLRLRVLPLLALTAAWFEAAAGPHATVEQFVAAFNRHDVEAMLEHASQDVRWMSVAGDQLSVDAAGDDALREAMRRYFAAIPSARSELRSLTESGPFVHTVEEAFWEVEGEQRSQCSFGVYRIEDALIAEVWYFPAYACPKVDVAWENGGNHGFFTPAADVGTVVVNWQY